MTTVDFHADRICARSPIRPRCGSRDVHLVRYDQLAFPASRENNL